MRLIFHLRPFKYFFYKYWYGTRTNPYWCFPPEKCIWFYDLGAITFGFALK